MTKGFPKSEKLCGELRIATLYKQSKRFVCWPVRVNYRFVPANGESGVQVLIWAPKSIFRHAVDRNRMRRLMRESFRLNAEPLRIYCMERGLRAEVAFNYVDKQLQPFPVVEKGIRKALKKMLAV